VTAAGKARGIIFRGDMVHFLARKCPYGVPGDRLWVREAFASFDNVGRPIKPSDATYVVLRDGTQVYRDGVIVPCLAVYAPGASDHIRWRSSRFMPRWASRLTLVVEAVRVERLSAITDEDAVAEGFVGHASANVDGAVLSVEPGEQYLAAFRAMHKLAADADPWLWVVTFKKEPANG